MNKSDLVQLRGNVELQATKSNTPRLQILAYTGGVMNVPSWGPTLIDLSGLDFTNAVTILDGHENRLGAILGSGRAVRDNGRLLITASLAKNKADEVLQLLDAGVALQASLGVRPMKTANLRPGAEVRILAVSGA